GEGGGGEGEGVAGGGGGEGRVRGVGRGHRARLREAGREGRGEPVRGGADAAMVESEAEGPGGWRQVAFRHSQQGETSKPGGRVGKSAEPQPNCRPTVRLYYP